MTLDALVAPTAVDRHALGCAVRLVVTEPSQLTRAAELLGEEIDLIDRAASRFRSDSELERVNDEPDVDHRISPFLARAIRTALDAARDTDGVVDPTVGSAMIANGYDRDFALVDAVAPAVTVHHAPVPGWRLVRFDERRGLLRVPAGVRLDLGATAKALASDLAACRIADATGCGVLVAIGGDVAVAGRSPHDGWSVRVQDVTGPVDAVPSGPVATLLLRYGGLATSSTAARRWVRGGRVMHHLVDPRSGAPVMSQWRTVSVAARDCVTANVASTAAIVLGDDAPAWLRRRGLAARLVHADGSVTLTDGWPVTSSAARAGRAS
jgi:thiamine biosynthesis lipoprotein